jgi:hypothetical protein
VGLGLDLELLEVVEVTGVVEAIDLSLDDGPMAVLDL